MTITLDGRAGVLSLFLMIIVMILVALGVFSTPFWVWIVWSIITLILFTVRLRTG